MKDSENNLKEYTLKREVTKSLVEMSLTIDEALEVIEEFVGLTKPKEILAWIKGVWGIYVMFDGDGSMDDVRCLLHNIGPFPKD